jgi:hypothetical protein
LMTLSLLLTLTSLALEYDCSHHEAGIAKGELANVLQTDMRNERQR